jgi:hypothetical protein
MKYQCNICQPPVHFHIILYYLVDFHALTMGLGIFAQAPQVFYDGKYIWL